MAFEVFSGVDPSAFPENRGGRKEGSKNKSTARRNDAIAKGVTYVEGGAKLNRAAADCIAEFKLTITVEHMAKLIREQRNIDQSS